MLWLIFLLMEEEKQEEKKQFLEIDRTQTLEQRVFRLESNQMAMFKTEGEMMDRLKNAHHRIDETNRDVGQVRVELKALGTKLDNLGHNLAEKDKRDKGYRKWTIIIGILAFAAFVGMFFQDSDTRKIIGEIAVKVGAGAVSVI